MALATYGMPDNPNYKVRIVQNGGPMVEAFVPETFQLSVTSAFGPAFGQEIQGSTVGKIAQMGAGLSISSQAMTAQIWQGTQPIEMSLELEFVADSDPTSQVSEPIQKLLQMTMPSKGFGPVLAPPGPKYVSSIDWKAFEPAKRGAEKQISIDIGRFLFFDNVVIESVNTTFHSMMHKSGVPLRATCSISFKTFFVQLSDNIPDLFGLPAAGETRGGTRGGQ